MTLFELKNISKTYGTESNKVSALKNISFKVEEGEMLCIMGVSGSGKSTLLNIIGCLDKPSSGEYYIKNQLVNNLNDKGLAALRNKTFGFVVQHYALLEDYSVIENIVIPLEYARKKSKYKKERVTELLKKLNIENKANNLPRELSGGQCQRVAIARALANNPDVILADEPTGALDHHTGNEVIEILRELNQLGKTIIIVTHDEKVSKKCNKIIYVEDGLISDKSII